MSTTEPPQASTTQGPARRDLVEAWYADRRPEPTIPDLDVADVAGQARGGTHAMEDTTVEDVARRVVKRLLDTEQAMLQHLEALEAEAERRTDLLMAQAELDAELIRLQARREAHRIAMAGAAGTAVPGAHAAATVAADPDQRSLDELTDSLSRFADEVDALHPADPSHRALH